MLWTPAQAQTGPTIVPPAPRGGAAAPPLRRSTPVRPGLPVVAEIVVEGTQRIEPETVRSYMLIKEGDPLDPDRINQSLKGLFSTGLFADVTLRREGDVIFVRVVENPIINRIAFEGDKKLEQEVLRNEVQLRPRIVYTRTRVQNDVKRILDLYRRTGRFAATVEPKVVQLPQNRVDLIFEIDEGPLTGIRRISFIGNREFSDRALREVIQTAETRWYRFLTSDDTYDPDRLTFDRELLRRHYLRSGYADFRVVSAVAELTPDRKDFFITFTIEEGARYVFDALTVESKIKDVKPEAIQQVIEIEKDDWYDSEAVDDTVVALSNAVGDLGFAFVSVLPNVRRDRDKRKIDIKFVVQEGPRVFIERIDIGGNVRTLDKVIRREFQVVEGDAFNSTKLRRSRTRIQNLGYFSRVDVNNIPGSEADKTVIKVDVSEQSTGELSVGAGFSSQNGPLVDLRIRERNLLGKGQDLRASITIAASRQNIDVGFTEPYFLDKELSFGLDAFHTASSNVSEFESIVTGAGVRLGYRLAENWSHRVRYTLRRDEITDVDNDASVFIQNEEGTDFVSVVGQDLTYDRRNSKIEPTDGFVVRLSNDVAGLGGDISYLKSRLSGAVYYGVAQDWVVSTRGEAGYIFGLGDDDVRISDRFFLGGDKLRGFDNGGVGPRDTKTDDALGGKFVYSGTVEMTFPLGLPKQFGVNGAVFTDAGSLTDLDFDDPIIADTASIRWSAGIGIAWRSPFGPVRLDFAVPILKEDFDETENIRFNFGTRF
ncbi:MAG: outer membrane protein assembly factor BamA [Alphaproteobacteria bacterium]|nr:outer membrane protein assembly factor BamA [Alphaproteobacteria bacterium]